MNFPSPGSPPPTPPDSIDAVASQWVLRRDRGLSASEQDELSQWLAADPRHGEALALHRWGWNELDRLTGLQTSLSALADPDLLAPRQRAKMRPAGRPLWWLSPVALAAAAALVVGLYLSPGPASPQSVAAAPERISTALAAPCERRVLEDGSVVELNRGSVVTVEFTPAARRVRIARGEANFTVAKDPARPFIVAASSYEVRAVGTAFNVRLAPGSLEVLVTEGKVNLSAALSRGDLAPFSADFIAPTPLDAGQFAVVSHSSPATPRIEKLTLAAINARLAWQPRLLDFNDATLDELRLSASFRSDNVEGFVLLMESAFAMRAQWRHEREIALLRGN